ncbi:Condensin complex subunit 1 [Galdieria sulphuraria]|uniref:Condensin complex subunit 1 n=1 Tax=Galdieria sulphuraria TaxID=130081 RepID=M2WUI9_GALSU|nr:condensin complex subunit 1 [Galdieria sulphuraria]EME27605.1 condensin complex subunit 1 [Galdieria sulphuraria]GJD09799.1 Condensin complex subunit 1 [Galdieria sulphuraria]|eukprot:XP_005704125.1 condensin complex subunit 1 [Galdieria sulphuraria]
MEQVALFRVPLHLEDLFKEESEGYHVTEEDIEKYETSVDIDEDELSRLWFLPFPSLSHDAWCQVFLGVYNFRTLEDEKKETLYCIVTKGVENALEYLREVQDPDIAKNLLKVTTFILTHFIVEVQKAHLDEIREQSPEELSKTQISNISKKTKQSKSKENHKWNWNAEKIGVTLDWVLRLLEKCFSKEETAYEVGDKEFISLFARVCYVLIEDNLVCRNRELKEVIFAILKVVFETLHYRPSAIAALLHLVRKYEHAAPLIAELIYYLDNNYLRGSLGAEVIQEISQYDPVELSKAPANSKNIATFLCELTDRSSAGIKENLSLLVDQLDCESYFVRNSVVHALGRYLLFTSSESKVEGNDEVEITAELRSSLFDILLKRVDDIHAFSRSKVLQVWQTLVENRVVPQSLFPLLMQQVVARLRDKSSIVRKNSIALFESLLSNNPFGPSLVLAIYESKLKSYQEDDSHLQKFSEPSQLNDSNTSTDKEKAMEFYQYAVHFIVKISEAIQMLSSLVWSRSSLDVQEAISCIVTARKFEVDNSNVAVRSMLGLVFSRDTNIRSAVIEAYIRLFVGDNEKDCLRRGMDVIRGVVQLVSGATIGEVACVQKLLEEFAAKKLIDSRTIQMLWDIVFEKIPGVQKKQKKPSLLVLTLIAPSLQVLISEQLEEMLLEQMKTWIREECELCCFAFRILQHSPTILKNKVVLHELGSELLGSLNLRERKMEQFERFLTSRLCLLEEFSRTIYRCDEKPSAIAAFILMSLYEQLSSALVENSTNEDNTGDHFENLLESYALNTLCILASLFHFSGHVALNELSLWESFIRRYRESMTNKQVEDGTKDIDAEEIVPEEQEDTSTNERYLDALLIHAKQEIISKQGVVGKLASLAVGVILQKHFYPMIKACAISYITKLMCVDESFCEQHLKVVFTVLASEEPASIRADIIIALCDLAVRYPNLIEPWSSQIFRCLQDSSIEVRRNTMMCITFLVLNDMMKVRGQVSEIVLCLVDSDSQVSNMCHSFFFEVSNKSKGFIYNILPEIISSLSSMKDLPEEHFKTIMSFLFSFIDKERHTEGLVERICQRFRLSDDVSCWRSLAYCLSLLSYSERTIGKLSSMLKYYGDKLHDAVVFQTFCNIVSKARKFSKTEFRAFLDDFEEKLVECQRKHEDPDENEQVTQTNESVDNNKNLKDEKRKLVKKQIRIVEETSEEEQDEEEDEEPQEVIKECPVPITEDYTSSEHLSQQIKRLSLRQVLRQRK